MDCDSLADSLHHFELFITNTSLKLKINKNYYTSLSFVEPSRGVLIVGFATVVVVPLRIEWPELTDLFEFDEFLPLGALNK